MLGAELHLAALAHEAVDQLRVELLGGVAGDEVVAGGSGDREDVAGALGRGEGLARADDELVVLRGGVALADDEVVPGGREAAKGRG
ncbi:hypothetical protein [Microbacterium sp. LMI12-1-1.1]|uniref:hypothetical protein n=1 Tax=Microbacterium sp. LMI12-1-1.1 TaxID=3135225 RepID=UPI003431A616